MATCLSPGCSSRAFNDGLCGFHALQGYYRRRLSLTQVTTPLTLRVLARTGATVTTRAPRTTRRPPVPRRATERVGATVLAPSASSLVVAMAAASASPMAEPRASR
jgi:hypothetical protein